MGLFNSKISARVRRQTSSVLYYCQAFTRSGSGFFRTDKWSWIRRRGGGHSHMSVDIKCLSIDPLFLRRSYTNDPLFLFSPQPMTPFFPLLYQILHKIANFCALRAHFEKFNDFVAILTENLQILPWNCIFAHWMTPIFGSPNQKSPLFLVPTPNDPLFSTKSYTERPLFSFSGRHLYVTFIFECPPNKTCRTRVQDTRFLLVVAMKKSHSLDTAAVNR